MHVSRPQVLANQNLSYYSFGLDATNVIKNWDDLYFEKLLVRFTYSMEK